MGNLDIRDAQTAFDAAIKAGVLSADPGSAVYAGLYMYMHSTAAGDHFKHINTRQYLTAPAL